MNYALNFTGAGHVTVPTLSGSTALGRIFRADVELSNYTTQFLFGESTANTNSSARINSATQIAVRIASGSTRTVTLAANSIPLNTRLVIEGWKVDGPLLEIRVNGVVVGSTAIGAVDVTTPMTINYIGIGASTTARFVGKMYELDLFGNTFLNTDQPNASTWGTGTLVGFPTDGTQWTAYSSTTPIAFTGTIPNQTFTNGDAVSVDLSTYFSGTQTPFTFANTGTSLTGTGLSITSAGLLSGTATTGSVSGVVITGTDASSNTAASNAFNVTVNAAATPVSFTGTVPTLTGTQNSAITPVDLSTYFSGSLTPFTYSLQAGTLPTGVTLNTSTGIISGTPTVSFSGNITVRATDTGANTADTNSFAVNIAAATTDGTITLSNLKNNTATPLASISGFYVTILSATNPKAIVYNTASVSSNASAAITFTNASIVQGTEYRYFIEKDGVAFAAGKVTAT